MDQQAAAGISKSDPRPGTAGGLSPVLGVGLFVLLAAIVAGYYALLLTSGHFDLFHPVPRGMVFNSMMEHMLQGRFDVDPDAVGYEAFLRDGRTYAYWGVFCALLRLPLMFAPGWRTVDVTVLSSLIAILLAVWFKLRALYFLLQRAPDGAGTRFLGILVGLAILFSGAQISFMRLSLYQEVCFWGAAFGAGFMLAALRGLLEDRFPLSRLCWMALLAGLALNTRVTCGINLYGALGLLVGALAFRSQPSSARLRLIAPLAVLGLFAVLTGVVNYGRWGNPFTFANYYIYALNLEPAHADNLARMDKYGLFSLERIPYGLIYYFFPIWALPSAQAPYQLLEPLKRLFDFYELPPSHFALTDPLLVGLFGWFLWRLVRGRAHVASPLATTAVLIGLTIGCIMLLSPPAMCYRYRMDFYPLLELGAFLGLNVALQEYGATRLGLGRRIALASVVAFGVIFSHGIMAVYKVTPGGAGWVVFPQGAVPGYRALLRGETPSQRSL